MLLLLQIVLTFAKIGVLSFGGGYASIGLIEREVVTNNGWMSYSEFADIIAIDELTPGPVAINAATFVGTKMAGIPGAIAATIGAVLPSCIIVLILVKLYYKYRNLIYVDGTLKGLRSMIVALIASTTITMIINSFFSSPVISFKTIDYVAASLFIVSFFILRKYKINPLLVMIGSGIIGLIIYSFISI